MDRDTNSDNTNNQNESEKIEIKVEKSTEEDQVENDSAPFQQAHKPGRLNKRNLLIGVSAALVLLFATLGYFNFNKSDAPKEQANQDQRASLGLVVTLIDGTAKYSKDGANWDALTTEISPEQGDLIQTDAASRVILTLDDGSIVRLNESSTARLDSLYADEIRIANISGEIYNRVVASERSFIVTVEDAEFAALGTAYSTVNKTTDKGVQVLQSSVSLSGTETKVDEGKQFFKSHQNGELKDKITDISVEELKSSAFMIWNLEQDKQSQEFKDKLGYLAKIEEQPVPVPAPAPASASIKLSGKQSTKGVTLSWTVSSIGSVEGFKVVRSKKTTTPAYGKDEAIFASGSSTRSYLWKDGSGVTYNYRVCAYKAGTCTVYSNSISLASPYTPPEPVVSGQVVLTLEGNVASWTAGGTAPHGFKLLVNTTPGVSYANSYKAFGTGSPYTITGLNAGTYYVQVCKRTGDSNISGGCTDYSNELTLVVP